MSQALSWSMFRVELVRDLNSEEGLWGWAVITKYCYCTVGALMGTDSHWEAAGKDLANLFLLSQAHSLLLTSH